MPTLTTMFPSLHSGGFLALTTDICLLISNSDTTVTYANRAAYNVLGYKAEDAELEALLGVRLSDLLAHNGTDITREMLISITANAGKMMIGLKAHDGQQVNTDLIVASDAGNITYLILRPMVSTIDICAECGKLTQMQERAGALGSRMRLLMNNAPIGYLFINRQYSIQWANEYFLSITHWPLQELIGLSLDHITPRDRVAFRHRMLEAAVAEDGRKKEGFHMYVRDYFNEGRFWKFDVQVLPEVAALNSIVIFMRQID